MKNLPPLYMREEPAWNREPFVWQKFPTAHDNDPELQAITARINLACFLAGIGTRRQYLRNCSPDNGDIVVYYDEAATRPMFREHWWQLSKSERKKLKDKSFIWTSYWEGKGARRRLVWLEKL